MKILILFIVPVYLLSCSLDSLSGKIEELDEEKVKKEYCKKRDWDYSKMKNDVCVVIDSEFKHFASIGTFASDRGCMGEECYFGGNYGSLSELTPKALEHYGWGDKSKRKELARKWTTEIVYVWESALTSKPSRGFSESEYFDPQVSEKDGSIHVKLWIREPAGMLNQSDYRLAEVIYSSKGEISSIKNLRNKTVFPEDE